MSAVVIFTYLTRRQETEQTEEQVGGASGELTEEGSVAWWHQPAQYEETGLFSYIPANKVAPYSWIGFVITFVMLSGVEDTILYTLLSPFAVFLFLAASLSSIAWWKQPSQKLDTHSSSSPTAPRDFRVYTIRLPIGSQWQPELAYSLMVRLTSYGEVVFRILASANAISWQILYVGDLALEASVITRAVRTVYPKAEVEVGDYNPPEFTTPFLRFVVPFRQSSEFIAPIKYPGELKNYDPLVTVANLADGLLEGGRIGYYLYVAEEAFEAHKKGERLLRKSDGTMASLFALQMVSASLSKSYQFQHIPSEKYVPQLEKIFRQKLNDRLFQAYLLVQIDVTDRGRLAHIIDVLNTFWELGSDYQTIVPHNIDKIDEFVTEVNDAETASRTGALALVGHQVDVKDYLYQDVECIFNPSELATLWHLPHEGFTAPTIEWASNRVSMPAVMRDKTEGVCLGDGYYAGQPQPVYMPYKNRRTHMAVFGVTGAGKSNFLHTLIKQDIENGKGVCVVDPLGNLVRDILRFSIPPEREKDVVVLDVANEDYPPPLNFVAVPKGATGTTLVNAATTVMGILEKIYGEFDDTRWSDTLSNALFTLWAEETPTIRDVIKIISTDPAYRKQLLAKNENDAVHDFWNEDFDQLSDREQRDYARPIKGRIRRFYRNPYVYAITCHFETIDFASLMRQRKIVLVSLKTDERKMPKREQQLLGALVVSQIQMAAMSGACEEHGFYLFVDEAQDFVTTSLDTMLMQARQFNLGLSLANQFLKQLVGGTLETVRGVMGTWVFFKIGDEDARIAARYTKPNFEADDFVQMDKYQAAIRMTLDATTPPAFSLSPRLAYEEPDEQALKEALAREARIRQKSIKSHTPRTRDEVMRWLRERYPLYGRRPETSQDYDDDEGEPID